MSQLARQGSSTAGEGISLDSGAIFRWSFSAHVCQSTAVRLLPPAAVRLLAELLPAAVGLLAAWPTFGPLSTTRCVFAQFALRTVSVCSVPLLFTDALLNGSGKRGTDALAINVLNGFDFGVDFGCICPIPKLSQRPLVSMCSMDSIGCALGTSDHLLIGTGG